MSQFFDFGAKGEAPGTSARYTPAAAAGRTSGFGATALVVPYERGPVGLGATKRIPGGVDGLGQDLADRILGLTNPFGGFASDIQGALATQHFFMKAGGAGRLYPVRITDGNERAASVVLLDRNVDQSYAAGRACAAAALPHQVALVSAANGGRWGGQANCYGGAVANVVTAISGSTFDTGLRKATSTWPFKKNELKGFSFNLVGETRTWTIASNTDDGVITVSGDFVGLAITGAANWRTRAENVDAYAAPRGLGVMVGNGTRDPEDRFRIVALENRKTIRHDADNLEMNPLADYYESLINQALDVSQYELAIEDLAYGLGLDPTLEKHQPANFAEIALPGGVGTNTVKFRILQWTNTGTGNGSVASLVDGGAMVPHKLVLTVKTGATQFTAAAYDLSGTRLLASGLADGTIGSAYAAPHPFLAGFTLTNGTVTYIAGDVITVYVRPLPVSAGGTGLLSKLGGWFYPHAYSSTGTGSKNVTTRYRVYSNTYDTVTLGPAEDVSAVVVEPGLPAIVGATNWDSTKDTSAKTVIYKLQGAAPVTITMTGAATQLIEDAVIELNTLAHPGHEVEFYVATVSGHKRLGIRANDALYGPAYNLQVTTGTLNAVCGWTDNTTGTGAVPTVGRLEFYTDLEAGRDGIADLATTHYAAAFDQEDSVLLTLKAAGVGCLKMACPGVSDASVQQAGMNFAEVTGFEFRAETPSTITGADGTAARTWWRAYITPNNFFATAYPSYGYLAKNPTGGQTKYLCTLSGAILGMEARYAADNEGYQKAAADTRALLSPIFSSLTTDLDNGSPVELDLSNINGFGLQPVVHSGPSIYVFGDRIPGENWVWGWKHKLECYLHIVHELLSNGDPLVFAITNGTAGDRTRKAAWAIARTLMLAHHKAAGGSWFKGGSSIDDCVDIDVGDNINTPAVQAAGKFYCAVGVDIVDTAEQVKFFVGPRGVAAEGGMR